MSWWLMAESFRGRILGLFVFEDCGFLPKAATRVLQGSLPNDSGFAFRGFTLPFAHAADCGYSDFGDHFPGGYPAGNQVVGNEP